MTTYKEPPMSTNPPSDRFAALPDDETLAETLVGLEERGFCVEVVDDLDAARRAVLARIPEGSSVMTNPSVTLQETGIAQAIDNGGPYDSARTKVLALDHATQLQEIKAIMGQPDFALGSVHAITRDGTLVIASASGIGPLLVSFPTLSNPEADAINPSSPTKSGIDLPKGEKRGTILSTGRTCQRKEGPYDESYTLPSCLSRFPAWQT